MNRKLEPQITARARYPGSQRPRSRLSGVVAVFTPDTLPQGYDKVARKPDLWLETRASPLRCAAMSDREARANLSAAQRRAVAELLQVSPVADELGRRFAEAGYELHLVGGSVRDALLGRLGEDLDFATNARPEQTQELLEDWAEAIWTTGAEFGTIGAAKRGLRVEVTTYRAEAYDRVSRNPIVRYGTSLQDDLRRRDFTVNAMAVSVPAHKFSDPYGGLDDLAAKRLRTPGAPEDSFADDPLRMLRAARFASQLRFEVDRPVVAAMTAMAGDLARITAERIRDEFVKLLSGADPVAGLRMLVDTGLAEQFLPELPGMRMAIDEHHQHKDVYEHTLTVVRNAIRLEDDGPDFVLRMAALMHDVGKPATKRNEPGGRVSFHHHEVVGARMTRQRMKALRFPKETIEQVSQLVFLHLRFHGYGTGEWTDSAVRRYVTDAGEERIARIQAEEDLARVRPDLDGNAIMELLGIPPGPLVGKAWRHLKELRLDRGPLSRDEAEQELRRWATDEGIAD